MNRKKIKLDYKEHYNFLLLGISSSEKEHRLVWSINNTMGLNFSRTSDHIVIHKKSGEEQVFSCFSLSDDYSYTNYRLISNKSENGYLLEELKNIDYFLIVHEEEEDGLKERLMKDLRQVDNIQAVFHINPEKLKARDRLIV